LAIEFKTSDFENITVVWDNDEVHGRDVWMVRFSPDGTKLVSVGFDGQIVIWDAETGNVLDSTFGHHTTNIRSVEWSPDGTQIATGDEKGIIKIWNASLGQNQTHALLNDEELETKNVAHIGPVVALSWSQDKNTLATVSGEDANLSEGEYGDNVVKLWDIRSGNKIKNLTQFKFQAMDVAFHPTDPEILGVAGDNSVIIYNLSSGKEIYNFTTNGTAHCIAWSPDGTYIATGTRNFDIIIFNFKIGTQVHKFYDPEFKRREIAWSPYGKFIAEAGSGEDAKIREVATGEIIKVLYGPSSNFKSQTRCAGNYLPSIAWSSNGRYIAVASAGQPTVTVFADKKYDKIAPEIIHFSPTGNSVQRDAAITIRFSEPVEKEIFADYFRYSNGTTTWTVENGTLLDFGREFIFYPDEKFPPDELIIVTVDDELTDNAGNKLRGKNFWVFRTSGNSAPVLSNSYVLPAGGSTRTKFTFVVHYTDYDGDLPFEINVIIDSIFYKMSWRNGSAFDGNYFYETKLSQGEHFFYFTASDGMADARGTPTGKDNFSLIVKKDDDVGGINPLTADMAGVIIILILILGWFNLVLKASDKKKKG